MRPDRADVLQRHGDAVARDRLLRHAEHEVAAELAGQSPARGVAADEVALLEELPLGRVVVELHVGVDAVVENRRYGVQPQLTRAGSLRRGARDRLLEDREPGEAEVLVGARAG